MNKKLSELTEKTTSLDPNDLLLVTTGGVSKSIKASTVEAPLKSYTDDKVAEEVDRAESAEASLSAAITSEANARAVAVASEASARATAISDEVAARTAAVSAETSRAMSVESSLSSAISAEASARSAAISAESSRAQSAESSLNSAISAESTARTNADTSLQNQINNIISNTDPAVLDSLTEVVSAFQTADSSLNGAITGLASSATAAIATESARAQTAEASISAALSAEASARSAAISAEESRAKAAEDSILASIFAESSARQAADVGMLKSNGSVSMNADFDMNNHKVVGVKSGENNNDAVNVSQLNSSVSTLQSALTSAQQTLTSAITQVGEDLSSETTRAQAAENSLSSNLYDHQSSTTAHAASNIVSSPVGNLVSTNVQAALNELQLDIDTRATSSTVNSHIASSTAHGADHISSTPTGNLSASNVQDALNELQSDIDSRATSLSVLSHTNSSAAHSAASITNAPYGNVASVTVQGAIDEIQSHVDTLSGRVDDIISNTDPATLDSLSEIVSAFQSGDSSLTTTVNNLASTKLNKAGDTMSGDLDMGNFSINHVANATTSHQAVNYSQLTSHISDATDAHAASSITNTPSNGLTSTDVQSAINELQSSISAISGGSASPVFQWNINGDLTLLGASAKRIDGSPSYRAFTPTSVKAVCQKGGLAGTLTVDVRKHQALNAPVISILPLFQATLSSVSATMSAISTQSIVANNTTLATQSISRYKSSLSVQSVIKAQGTNQWKYNFSGSLLNADYQVGKTIVVSSCSNAGNNGTFIIVEVNHGNFPSIVVTNASGVAQTSAAGVVDLQLFSYNFLSAVPSDYVAGDSFTSTSHTNAANNGTFTVYKINQGGNNLIAYNASGVTQGTVTGSINSCLWKYTYASAVNTTYFVVGQKAKMASHTNAANNGNFTIRGLNVSGNNIVVYNPAGVAQAGVAGNALPNLWIMNFSANPVSTVSVNDYVKIEGSSTSANNGTFQALAVGANYVVVYNEAGAVQSSSGTAFTTKFKATMNSTTASLGITTDSKVEFLQTSGSTFIEGASNLGYQVTVVGTSDFTFEERLATISDFQSSPCGYISIESKSVLASPISISSDLVGVNQKELISASVSSNGSTVPANTWLGVWVTSNFTSGGQDLSVTVY
jgi:hypothetical protein